MLTGEARTGLQQPQHRGAAMIMVMIALVFAVTLSITFMVSQSSNTAIAANVNRHAKARMIAESGLTTAIEYVRTDADWRTDQADGHWVADHDYAGGVFRVLFEDDDGDGVTVTVVGAYEGVTHTVRALMKPGQWAATGNRVLFVAGTKPVNTLDQLKIDLISSWGYTVTVIEDSETQSRYDAAIAVNDVIYVSEECAAGTVAGKIDETALGVVNEKANLHDTFGFISSDGGADKETSINIVDNSHPITDGLSLGDLTVLTSDLDLAATSQSLAAGGAGAGRVLRQR